MKVTILGAGEIGSHVGLFLALGHDDLDIFLIDINKDKAEGQAMDINQTLSAIMCEHDVHGTDDFRYLNGSDVVVIAVGNRRRKGMIRTDLFPENQESVRQAALAIKEHCKRDPIVIVVTNPLDEMSQIVYDVTGLPASKVIGMGNSLDTARYREVIHRELKLPRTEINCIVTGEHGENMQHRSNVAAPAKWIEDMSRQTAIDTICKKGATVFAPATCTIQIIESILYDMNSYIPISTYHKKDNKFYGTVEKVGKNGVIH